MLNSKYLTEGFKYDDYYSTAQYLVESKFVEDYVRLMASESLNGIDRSLSLMVEASVKEIKDEIVAFFKRIWDLFMDKVGELTGKNDPWLKANAAKFADIDYKDITVSIYPYWQVGYNEFSAIVDEIRKRGEEVVRKLKSNENGWSGDMDELKETMYKGYANKDGDFVKGLHSYLRCKDVDKLEEVTLGGNDLKTKVTSMIDYCKNYKRIAGQLTNIKNKIEQDVNKAATKLASHSDSLKESYSLIEEAFHVTFEADEEKSTNGNVSGPNDNKGPTGEDKPKSPDNREDKGSSKSKEALEKKVLDFQTNMFKQALTGFMTFLEEKNNTYMKVLKAIISKAEGVSEEEPGETSEKKEAQKEEKK